MPQSSAGSSLPKKSSSRSRSPRLKLEAAHHIFVNTAASDAYFSMPTIGTPSPDFERRCRTATGIERESRNCHIEGQVLEL
jgi:hypothetical protein